jgi:hypothetical protein
MRDGGIATATPEEHAIPLRRRLRVLTVVRTRTVAAHAGSEALAEGGTNFCTCWYSTPATCSPTSSANCGDDLTDAQYLCRRQLRQKIADPELRTIF